MAQLGMPIDGVIYDSDEAGIWFQGRTNGVFSANDSLKVTAAGGMSISISSGGAWMAPSQFRGISYANTSPVTLTLNMADGMLHRIDRVVIRWNITQYASQPFLAIKQGTLSSNPVAPTVDRTSSVWELGLADIRVNAGTLILTQANITDQRLNEAICGLVRDGIEHIPTAALEAQWKSWFTGLKTNAEQDANDFIEWIEFFKSESNEELDIWLNEKTEEFNSWFETIKDVLDEETAGNLYNLIQDLQETKAPINSPQFTGTPTAPSVLWTNSSLQIAPTNFVHSAISNTAILRDGWIPDGVVLTYNVWNAETYIGAVNTGVNLTSYITKGMKVKFTQGTVKYAIVVDITSSTMMLFFGTNYTLATTTISNFYYSNVKAPLGFPLNPNIWTLTTEMASNQQATPTLNSFYNIGSYNLKVPIGSWEVGMQIIQYVRRAASGLLDQVSCMSTTTTSTSNLKLSMRTYAQNLQEMMTPGFVKDEINITSTTTFYFLVSAKQSGMSYIGTNSEFANNRLFAKCMYL